MAQLPAGWLEHATNPPSHYFPSVAVEIMLLLPSFLLVLKPEPSLIQSTPQLLHVSILLLHPGSPHFPVQGIAKGIDPHTQPQLHKQKDTAEDAQEAAEATHTGRRQVSWSASSQAPW